MVKAEQGPATCGRLQRLDTGLDTGLDTWLDTGLEPGLDTGLLVTAETSRDRFRC